MRIKKNNIYIGVSLFVITLPYIFKNMISSEILMVITTINFITVFCVERRKIKIHPSLLFLLILLLWEFISTELNSGNVLVWSRYMLIYLALYFLTIGELLKNKNEFLKVGSFIFELYIYFEILFLLIGKDFLGNYNQIYIIYPCLAAILLILNYQTGEKKYKIKFWSTTIIAVLGCLLAQVQYGTFDFEATFFISIFLLIIFVLFPKLCEMVSMKICMIGVLLLNITLVITQSLLKNGMVEFIVQNLLHKNINLTGRTDLWKMSVYTISEKPILGYGISWNGLNIWGGKFAPHNQFLYFACVGGIIFLVCLGIWIVYLAYKSDESLENRHIYKICQYSLLSQFILFLSLSYSFEQLIPFWLLMYITSFYVEKRQYMYRRRKFIKWI